MEVQKIAQEFRLRQWSQVISECQGSGMTVKNWCQANGINLKTYYNWLKKVREAACNGYMTVQSQENGLVPNGWTQLADSEPVTAGILSVEVSGCRISATAETDLELLVKVCRALRSL